MSSPILRQLNWRYATKKFDSSKKISAETLAVLTESFNLTASSYGLQPLKMLVVKTQTIKEKLVPATANQRQVGEASHVLVLCTEKNVDASFIKNHFERVEIARNTAREILEPFEISLLRFFEEMKPDEVEQWKTNQAYLAMGNLLTVCALAEIDSCPIEGFDPDKYADILRLREKKLKAVLVLAVGYRAEDDFFISLKKVRRGTKEVVIEL